MRQGKVDCFRPQLGRTWCSAYSWRSIRIRSLHKHWGAFTSWREHFTLYKQALLNHNQRAQFSLMSWRWNWLRLCSLLSSPMQIIAGIKRKWKIGSDKSSLFKFMSNSKSEYELLAMHLRSTGPGSEWLWKFWIVLVLLSVVRNYYAIIHDFEYV